MVERAPFEKYFVRACLDFLKGAVHDPTYATSDTIRR